VLADSFRRLQSPFFLLLQLLFYEGWGDWSYLNSSAERTLAVTAEDIQRVAKRYFTVENRTVATYQRKAGTQAEPVPPELAGLPAEQQRAIQAQLKQLGAISDPAQLGAVLEQIGQQKAAAPAEMQPVLALFEQRIRERLAELEAGGTSGSGTGEVEK
jgi:hypothetical protein